MELTGFAMAQVLTALGVAGAAVTVLYLLKLRRRRVPVPFVKLWEQVLAEKQTTRLFSQLKRWLSLLIALSIVALLAFALGDPRRVGATDEGRTLVVLLDGSASMQATDVEPTRYGAGLEATRRLIRGLGPADRMLLARLEGSATPITPLTSEPRLLLEALEGLEPVDVPADLRAGLRLALDVLRDQSRPEVVLVSDGGLEGADAFARRLVEADTRLSWSKVGVGRRNVGITAFAVRRYPLDKSQSEVLVELWNTSEEDEAIELVLLGDGEPVDVQRITIAAGERLRRFFRNVSGVDRTLEARLSLADGSRDQLPADDHAFARLPERRRARVLVISEGNLYLQASLLLDEYLDVTEITPSEYPIEGHFDVMIFDNFVPPSTPRASALYLYPDPGESETGPFEVLDRVETPYFSHLERRHPLLRWTALRDVNIGSALKVRTVDGDRVIAGDRGVPLIVEGSREGRRFVALTFDLRVSDLPLRTAWPLFLLNTIDHFVQESAGYVSSFATGDSWRIPAPANLEEVVVVDPDGEEHTVPVVDGRAIYAGQRAGFYQLETEGGSEAFAANLGSDVESSIAVPETLSLGELAAEEPTHGELGVREEIWAWLVLLALLVLGAEWMSYHRRWTV